MKEGRKMKKGRKLKEGREIKEGRKEGRKEDAVGRKKEGL
jgi:hypothetical protein